MTLKLSILYGPGSSSAWPSSHDRHCVRTPRGVWHVLWFNPEIVFFTLESIQNVSYQLILH